MEENRCKNCKHFLQHYIMDEGSCAAVNCGHCTVPRLKTRKPDAPACVHYVRRETPAPANRHFLTAELLRWIQTLELPPEIR